MTQQEQFEQWLDESGWTAGDQAAKRFAQESFAAGYAAAKEERAQWKSKTLGGLDVVIFEQGEDVIFGKVFRGGQWDVVEWQSNGTHVHLSEFDLIEQLQTNPKPAPRVVSRERIEKLAEEKAKETIMGVTEVDVYIYRGFIAGFEAACAMFSVEVRE